MTIQELYTLFLQHPLTTTDSRTCPAGSIFFALKGASFDGNRFASKALDSGCRLAVVDDAGVVPTGDERYILVDDVLTTYQRLAHEHREHFHHPVLEITGTNGKTTTKELTAAVLGQKFNVLATEANYNNHIGVPRTLLRLSAEHNFAVIETGANHPGEINTLAHIVDPDCGLITNVGRAHLEGFGSFEGVVRTKGELYDYLRQKRGGFIFRQGENEHLSGISCDLKSILYGHTGHEGYLVEGEEMSCAPYLKLRWRPCGASAWHEVQTRLIGSYNFDNVMAAACVGTFFGVPADRISAALTDYTPTNDRSELKQTAHNVLIIDAYNANPSSMAAALKNFAAMNAKHKMVILGDMRELGSTSAVEHQKIVDFLATTDIETVWLVGENFKKARHRFRTFDNVDAVKYELKRTPVENHLILIKGSNGTKLFQLPDFL